MKVLVAIVMGLMSGLMVYFTSALFLITPGQSIGPSTTFVTVTLLGGWVGSTLLLLKNAKTTAKVFSRGFLLGAAEWMVVLAAGVLFSGRAVGATVASSSSDAELAGAAIGGGLVAFLTGGVSIAMALVCLIGFAISYSMSREMKPELASASKKCPECAELVQEEARRCRYCGASFLVNPSPENSS